MEGLAAPAEHLNVTVVPAHTLVGVFSETLSGLSAEKKFYNISFALLSLTQRNPGQFFMSLSSILREKNKKHVSNENKQ